MCAYAVLGSVLSGAAIFAAEPSTFAILLLIAVIVIVLGGSRRGRDAWQGFFTVMKIGLLAASVLTVGYLFSSHRPMAATEVWDEKQKVAISQPQAIRQSTDRQLQKQRETARRELRIARSAATRANSTANVKVESPDDPFAGSAPSTEAPNSDPGADPFAADESKAPPAAESKGTADPFGADAHPTASPDKLKSPGLQPESHSTSKSSARQSKVDPLVAKFLEYKPANPEDPAYRPKWLTQPVGRERDTYQTTVTVGPYTSPAECEEEFSVERDKAVKAYVASYLGPEAGRSLHIAPAYINENIVKEVYYEPIKSDTVGPMINMHALLAFDSRVRTQFERMWRDEVVEGRLLSLAGGAGVVLLALAAVFGYLKLDTLTRGYYTRRLQFLAAAVILAAAAGGVSLIRRQ